MSHDCYKKLKNYLTPEVEPQYHELETVYPVTHERAVRDNDDTPLETKLSNINTAIHNLEAKQVTSLLFAIMQL
jgi:hypothetical protein